MVLLALLKSECMLHLVHGGVNLVEIQSSRGFRDANAEACDRVNPT